MGEQYDPDHKKVLYEKSELNASFYGEDNFLVPSIKVQISQNEGLVRSSAITFPNKRTISHQVTPGSEHLSVDFCKPGHISRFSEADICRIISVKTVGYPLKQEVKEWNVGDRDSPNALIHHPLLKTITTVALGRGII